MTTILWADDQIDVIKSAAAALAEDGFYFEFCSNGIDALKKANENQYDIILIDLAMPPGKWGGLWFLEEIKKTGEERDGVIVVSGEGTQAETIKALRLGATDYITKEELVKELGDRIRTAIDESQRTKNLITSIISCGESEVIEFKSTLRKNLRTNNNDHEIELSVFKTICGFLNKNGGTLLIGVNDSGETIGLDNDEFKNHDKFQLHFWNIFKESIGVEFVKKISAEIVTYDKKTIFHIKCEKSDKPIFLKWRKENKNNEFFFVRVGPQTDQLGTRQAVEYINDNF